MSLSPEDSRLACHPLRGKITVSEEPGEFQSDRQARGRPRATAASSDGDGKLTPLARKGWRSGRSRTRWPAASRRVAGSGRPTKALMDPQFRKQATLRRPLWRRFQTGRRRSLGPSGSQPGKRGQSDYRDRSHHADRLRSRNHPNRFGEHCGVEVR